MASVKCPLCPPQSNSKNDFFELGTHILVKHGASIVDFYVCPCCPEAYKGEEALQAHLFYDHNYNQPYKMTKKWLSMACADCGVSFRIDEGGKSGGGDRKEEWAALAKFMVFHSPDHLVPYHVYAMDTLREVPQLRQRLTRIPIEEAPNSRCPHCRVSQKGRLELMKHVLRGCQDRQPSARLSLAFREDDNSIALELNSKMKKIINNEDLSKLEHDRTGTRFPIILHGVPSNAKAMRRVDSTAAEFGEKFEEMEKRLKFASLAPLPAYHTQRPCVPYTPNGLRSIFYCCMSCRMIVAGAMRALTQHRCANGERPKLRPLFFPRPSSFNARISCPICDQHTSCSVFGLQTHLSLEHDLDFTIDEQVEHVDETSIWEREDSIHRPQIAMNRLSHCDQYFAPPKSVYLPKESFFRLCRICMSVMPPDDKYYEDHLKKHAKQLKVKSCYECSLLTDGKTTNDHNHNHSLMQYRCIPCRVAFRDDTRYYLHLSTVHHLDLVHFCKRCNLATKSVTRLRAHIFAKACQHNNLPLETYQHSSPGVITECLFSFESGLIPGGEFRIQFPFPAGCPSDRPHCSFPDCARRTLVVPEIATNPADRQAQFTRVSCPNDLFPLAFNEYTAHETSQLSKYFRLDQQNLEIMKRENEVLLSIKGDKKKTDLGIWNPVSCFFYGVQPVPTQPNPFAAALGAAAAAKVQTGSIQAARAVSGPQVNGASMMQPPASSSASSAAGTSTTTADNVIKDSPCTSAQSSVAPSLKRPNSSSITPTPSKQRKVDDEEEELQRLHNVARTICSKKYRLCMENFCKFGEKFDHKPWQIRATMLEIGPPAAKQSKQTKCLFCQSMRATFGIPPESIEEWIDSFAKSSELVADKGELYKKLYEKNRHRRVCARHFDISEIDSDDALDGTRNPLPKFMSRKCLVCATDVIAGLEIPLYYKEQVRVLSTVPGCKLNLQQMMQACEKEVQYACHWDALIASDRCPISLPPEVFKIVHTPSFAERLESNDFSRAPSPTPSDEDSLLHVLAEARRDAMREPPTPFPPVRAETPPADFNMPATPATLRRIMETPVSSMDMMPATPMHRETVDEIKNSFRSFESASSTSNAVTSAQPSSSSHQNPPVPVFAVPSMPSQQRQQPKQTACTSTTQSTQQQQMQQNQRPSAASSSAQPSGPLWHLIQQGPASTSTSQPVQPHPPAASIPTSRVPPQPQQQQKTLFSELGPPTATASRPDQQQNNQPPPQQAALATQRVPLPPSVHTFTSQQQLQYQQQQQQLQRQYQQQQFVQVVGNQQMQRGIVPQQIPQQSIGSMNMQQQRMMQQQQQQLLQQQMAQQQHQQQMQQMPMQQHMIMVNGRLQVVQQNPPNLITQQQQRAMQQPQTMQQQHIVYVQHPQQFMLTPQQQAEIDAQMRQAQPRQQLQQQMFPPQQAGALTASQHQQQQQRPGPSNVQQSAMKVSPRQSPHIPQQPINVAAQAQNPVPSCGVNSMQQQPNNSPVSRVMTPAAMREFMVNARQRLVPNLAIESYRNYVNNLSENDLNTQFNTIRMMQEDGQG